MLELLGSFRNGSKEQYHHNNTAGRFEATHLEIFGGMTGLT